MNEKIKILFLAANPQDVKFRLDLAREVSDITEKIRSGLQRDCFELVSEWCVKPGLLQQHLRNHKPQILHFSGHGNKSNGLAFEDDNGRTVLVNKQAFTRLIKLHKKNIRIVMLNACDTRDQARFLSETVDYTIGMNRPILDEAARVFAATFYQALAFGDSVQDAFESALTDLDLTGIKGSKIPELLVRRGVDPTKPFLDHPYAHREDLSAIPPKAAVGSEQRQESTGNSGIMNTSIGGGTITVHGPQTVNKTGVGFRE